MARSPSELASPIVTDVDWMSRALALAREAAAAGEVPVGAVIVRDGELLAEGLFRTVVDADPTTHAEVVAIRRAAFKRMCPDPQATSQTVMLRRACWGSGSFSLSAMM